MVDKTTKKRPAQLASVQLIVRPPQRKTSDVAAWRQALQSADLGRMRQLYDLYDDLLIDGVLSDAVDKRISAVTNSPITFQNAKGEQVPQLVDLIDSPDFEELLSTIMQARFWGRAAGEFSFADGYFNFTPIPFKHIKLENKSILINETDDKGLDYAADDHILVIGKPGNFGLFLKTAPFAIWKRGGFGDYAQWLELFGMPQRIGKYSSYDPESRQTLVAAMEQAGSAPWLVVPKETEIETVNNTGSGSSSGAHNDFRKACNEEMLITILGQTMTTLDGSSRSQSETHKEVEEGKNRADMRFVRRVLNWLVVPLLEKRGFPVKGGKFVFPEAAEPISVTDLVQLADIIEIPVSFLHDKYSIPQALKGEPIARKVQAAVSVTPEEKEKEKAKAEAEEKDKAKAEEKAEEKENVKLGDEQRNWLMRLYDFFVAAPGSGAINGSRLTLDDNTSVTGDTFNDRLIRRVADDRINFDTELFTWMASDLMRALDNLPQTINLADYSFVYQYQDDAFRVAQEMNIFRFSAAKDYAEIMKLNELFRQSKSFGEFHREAMKVTDTFNDKWQKTEYQSAVNIASATAEYYRLKSKSHIFPYWEYRTIGDGKVRPEHEKLNGLILEASDSLWNKIYPPNGWKCRCRVVPRLKSEVPKFDKKMKEEMQLRVANYLETPEWNKIKETGFGVNRALLPEVFNENQMYVRRFPNMAAKVLKDVNYQTWKLGPPKQLRDKAIASLEAFTGSVEDFERMLVPQDGKTFLNDYNGRLLLFNYKQWEKGHSAEKYADRPKLLKGLAETVALPDEVWVNGPKSEYFNQFTLIKFYKDVAVVVVAGIDDFKYQVKTWFVLNEYKGAIMDRRNGLLVYLNKRQP